METIQNEINKTNQLILKTKKELSDLEEKYKKTEAALFALEDKKWKLRNKLTQKILDTYIPIVVNFIKNTKIKPNTNNLIKISGFPLTLKKVTSPKRVQTSIRKITKRWEQNTKVIPKTHTTSFCGIPDYWEDETVSIDNLMSLENKTTNETLTISYYANHTKGASKIWVDGQLSPNTFRTIITLPIVTEYDFTNYPGITINFANAIKKEIQ